MQSHRNIHCYEIVVSVQNELKSMSLQGQSSLGDAANDNQHALSQFATIDVLFKHLL